MGKFLRSLTDGSLRCRYCGDKICNCMEDGRTKLNILAILKATPNATLFRLGRQNLVNGKQIPSKAEVWIPNTGVYKVDIILKYIMVDNIYINKMVFNPIKRKNNC